MKAPLRVLVVEDSEFDAHMMISLLRKGGYEVTSERVETREGMQAALTNRGWDLVLSDYNLPDFNAPAALQLLKESGRDLPFIIVSGGIGEDIAVDAMKSGAHDYLMKGNLHRLLPAVERELREAANRAGQREAKKALLESEHRYRMLWETAPDAVVLMDHDSIIQFANPAVREVFGYLPEEVIGKSLTMLQPEALRGSQETAFINRFIHSSIQLGRRATETLGRRKDGVEIPIEVSFTEMSLNGERRFVGFIRDVTMRKRAEREIRESQEQFRVAREIQQRLFPKSSPVLGGFDIAGATYPAEATGGDYFDYLPMLNDRWGIIVADVTGHGVGPALLMAETRAYLRVLAGRREDVGEILTRANGVLAEDVGSERFVTLFLARLDPKERTLVYASAGHPQGYILDAAGKVKQILPRTGVPLGIQPDTTYQPAAEIKMESGDVLLALTDGIEEAAAIDDTLFGIDRVLDVVRAHQKEPAQQIVHALYAASREFSQNAPQMDDVTAIVIKVL
jgi:PAS domain S-box-containing protein